MVLDVNDIISFEKKGRYIQITLYRKLIHTSVSMINLRSSLEANHLTKTFLKPHNSYIININYIKSINLQSVTMVDNRIIPISNTHRKTFFSDINNNFVVIK